MSINCEFHSGYCGMPLENNVDKLGEGNCLTGMKRYRNESFYTHIQNSIIHNS